MPVCTNPRCESAGVDQPPDAFPMRGGREGRSRRHKRCRRCRNTTQREWWAEGRGDTTTLDAQPFREWLMETFDTPTAVEDALGISRHTARELWEGRHETVQLRTVDKACLAWGISIDSLYPLEAASFAGTETVPPQGVQT